MNTSPFTLDELYYQVEIIDWNNGIAPAVRTWAYDGPVAGTPQPKRDTHQFSLPHFSNGWKRSAVTLTFESLKTASDNLCSWLDFASRLRSVDTILKERRLTSDTGPSSPPDPNDLSHPLAKATLTGFTKLVPGNLYYHRGWVTWLGSHPPLVQSNVYLGFGHPPSHPRTPQYYFSFLECVSGEWRRCQERRNCASVLSTLSWEELVAAGCEYVKPAEGWLPAK